MTKAVVITGASSGIGRATAKMAASRGYLVFGTVRTEADAANLANDGVEPLLMDVTDDDSVRAAADRFRQSVGNRQLAALINNAGVQAVGPIELIDVEDFRYGVDVNVLGVVRTTQAWLPTLRAHRGRIINVSSVSGCVALPFIGPYVATKFALEGLSDSLRRELAPHGVSVIVVQPGSIKTPIWSKVSKLDTARFRVEPYARFIDGFRAFALANGEQGLPAERVAHAIMEAVTATPAPIRMRIVKSGWKSRLSEWLPAKWLDRMVARQLESMTR